MKVQIFGVIAVALLVANAGLAEALRVAGLATVGPIADGFAEIFKKYTLMSASWSTKVVAQGKLPP